MKEALATHPPIDRQAERNRQALELLEHGYERATSPEGFQQYLKVVAHLYQYSARNIALIFAQRPDATYVNSYDRWKEAGRQVKKRPPDVPPGEWGIKVFFPYKQIADVLNEETGEVQRQTIVTGFGLGQVYDISQTDGPPIEPPTPPTDKFGLSEQTPALEDKLSYWLLGQGIRLATEPCNVRGYYSELGNKIVLGDHLSPSDGRFKTLVHEAAHRTMGHTRKDDDEASLQELEAEGTAFATLYAFGIDTSSYSMPYLAHWTREKDQIKHAMPVIAETTKALVTAITNEPATPGVWWW